MYYYIKETRNGPFAVCGSDEDFYRQRVGNLFTDENEAINYCLRLNRILWKRAPSFKDKNGDDVYIGDYVELDDDIHVIGDRDGVNPSNIVTVSLVSQDSSSFMFYGSDAREKFITDFSKVTLIKECGQ